MASDPVPSKAKPKTWVHHKMSDDKALRILPGLRAGLTLRQVGEVPRRFNAYCDAHPEYARETRPLEAANAEAARRRKGDSLRTTTHCRGWSPPDGWRQCAERWNARQEALPRVQESQFGLRTVDVG